MRINNNIPQRRNWENGRLGMSEIRRTYDGTYGGHTADIWRMVGGHTTDIAPFSPSCDVDLSLTTIALLENIEADQDPFSSYVTRAGWRDVGTRQLVGR